MKTIDEVAEKMYELVVAAKGQKKLTPRDLQTSVMELFGAEVDKKICKEAVKHLTSTGRCIYSMYGGVSYVEVPPE